jgi:hypothetical protein
MSGGMQAAINMMRGWLSPPQTFTSNLVTSSSQTSYLQFKPNGQVARTRSGAVDEYIGQWYNTTTPDIGAQHFIYFEPIAGSGFGGGAPNPPNVGSTLIWQLLSTERTIGYSGRAFHMSSFRIYIGDNVSGAPTIIQIQHTGVVSVYP